MIEYSEDLQKLSKKTKKDIKELIGKGDFIRIPEKPKHLELGEIVAIEKIEREQINGNSYWIVSLINGKKVPLSAFGKFIGEDLFKSFFVVTEVVTIESFMNGKIVKSHRYKFAIAR